MDDKLGASYVPSDPDSWVRAALGEIEDSPVPGTAIRHRGRMMRIRRRMAVAAALTGTVAAAVALAVSLAGNANTRHDVGPLHRGRARPPERVQAAGAPMIAAQSVVGRCAALSPDGRMLVVGDENGSAYIFRLADRRLLRTLPPVASNDPVVSVAYAPNGRYLAVARSSGQIPLWSAVTHRVRERLFFANPVRSIEQYQVAFSPGGAILAAAYGNGQLVLWHLAAPGRPAVLKPPGQPRHSPYPPPTAGLAFSPDGRQVAVFNGGELDIWSITGYGAKLVRQIRDVSGYSLQYSPAGSMIAVGSNRGTILLDPAIGQRTAFLRDPAGFRVYALAFSPDGSTLAAADGNNSIFLWDMARRAITAILKHPATDGGEMWVSFTPDQHSVVALTANNYTRVWMLGQRQSSSAAARGVGRPPRKSNS